MDDWAVIGSIRTAQVAFALGAVLSGCVPASDPKVGLSVDEAVTAIDQAPRSELTANTVAEAFALGSRATNVQRNMLQTELVGRVVEWDIPVFDVAFVQGRYRVTSEALPVTDADAAPLLRVVAFVSPRVEPDNEVLRAVQTGSTLRIRGQVQQIRWRTVVVIVPALVVRDVG